jgi:penicillin V acylase-like amidase (Ntn superfamily)
MTKQIITLSLAIATVVAVSSMGTSVSAEKIMTVNQTPASKVVRASQVKTIQMPKMDQTKTAVRTVASQIKTMFIPGMK